MTERINKTADTIGKSSPSYLARVASSKVTPTKKGDIKLKHNLLDIVGETLLEGLQKGKLSSKPFEKFQADVDYELTDKWSLNLGYNQDMAGIRQALKATVSLKL